MTIGQYVLEVHLKMQSRQLVFDDTPIHNEEPPIPNVNAYGSSTMEYMPHQNKIVSVPLSLLDYNEGLWGRLEHSSYEILNEWFSHDERKFIFLVTFGRSIGCT